MLYSYALPSFFLLILFIFPFVFVPDKWVVITIGQFKITLYSLSWILNKKLVVVTLIVNCKGGILFYFQMKSTIYNIFNQRKSDIKSNNITKLTRKLLYTYWPSIISITKINQLIIFKGKVCFKFSIFNKKWQNSMNRKLKIDK